MKILIIAQRCPYPPNKGEKIRTFHQLKFLKECGHDVILASPFEDDSEDKYFDELGNNYCIDVIKEKLPLIPFRYISGLLANKALSISNFYSTKLQSKIDSILVSQNIDVILCSASSVSEYVFRSKVLSKSKTLPILIMDFMDVDSDKWQQYQLSHKWPLSLVYARESRLIAKSEAKIAKAFDHCLLITQSEVNLFQRIHGNIGKLTAIENGLDTQAFYPPKKRRQTDTPYFLFAGVMDYAPNIDAVMWFVDLVWPSVKQTWPNAKFCIAGMNPTDKIRKLQSKEGIEVTGFVNDIKPYFDNSNIFIAPFRMARGVQNKILQAFACGLPVIASSMGAEGIRYKIDHDILLADTPEQFLLKIEQLLDNENNYSRISNNALNNIVHNYSWEHMLSPLKALLKK